MQTGLTIDPSELTEYTEVHDTDSDRKFSSKLSSPGKDWRKITAEDVLRPNAKEWLMQQDKEWLVDEVMEMTVNYEQLFWKHCQDVAMWQFAQRQQGKSAQAQAAYQMYRQQQAALAAAQAGYDTNLPKTHGGIFPIEDTKDRSLPPEPEHNSLFGKIFNGLGFK